MFSRSFVIAFFELAALGSLMQAACLSGQEPGSTEAVREFRRAHEGNLVTKLSDYPEVMQLLWPNGPNLTSAVFNLQDPESDLLAKLEAASKLETRRSRSCLRLPSAPISGHAYQRKLADLLKGTRALVTGRIASTSVRFGESDTRYTADILVEEVLGEDPQISEGSMLAVELPAARFVFAERAVCLGSQRQFSHLPGAPTGRVAYLVPKNAPMDAAAAVNTPLYLLWIEAEGTVFYGTRRPIWTERRLKKHFMELHQ